MNNIGSKKVFASPISWITSFNDRYNSKMNRDKKINKLINKRFVLFIKDFF